MSSAGASPSPSPQPYSPSGQNGYGAANGSAPSANGSTPALGNIVRKKLMGYVGFANLPNQVHRKSIRKGFQFTCMVVGESLIPLKLFHFKMDRSSFHKTGWSLPTNRICLGHFIVNCGRC